MDFQEPGMHGAHNAASASQLGIVDRVTFSAHRGSHRVRATRVLLSASNAGMPTGSVGSIGTIARRVPCSFLTLSICGRTPIARSRRRVEVGSAAARELLTTHAQGWICTRSRSDCRWLQISKS